MTVILLCGVFVAVIAIAVLFLYYLFYPAIIASSNEEFLQHIQVQHVQQQQPTSKLDDGNNKNNKTILLSIIIPAYDEELRLLNMIQNAYKYLSISSSNCKSIQNLITAVSSMTNNDISSSIQNNNTIVIEWIVIDDGSKDRTVDVYKEFVRNLPPTTTIKQQQQQQIMMEWKLIQLPYNCGKGAAVQAGMLSSNGEYRLMVDADGATEFGNGLEAVTNILINNTNTTTTRNNDFNDNTLLKRPKYDIVLGSRAQVLRETNQSRSFIRTFLMQAFHICVIVFVNTSNIQDTQCGFKLFHKTAAIDLFNTLHLRRWAFDTEILYISQKRNYNIYEINVPWHEVDGSKLHTGPINLALVSISMLRDMICVRLCYTIGIWKLISKTNVNNMKNNNNNNIKVD